MLAPGARLGPYEVIAPLGAGGMGEVYRARDPRLGRDVALKILPGIFAGDPDRLRRFEQEARAAAALNHANILAVYDVGAQDGSPYIVSELLDGEPLRARMHTAVPIRRALDYALQIAHGLAAAHERGIVHRDLKPENVVVTAQGRVKILDFGLAKLVQREFASASSSAPTAADATGAGLVMGTAAYMSPEQVRGDAVDHRSDIFSFGVVLYELLAGRRPFEGNSPPETMSAILRDDPPDLEQTSGAVPQALARIVERCLQKTPSSRFQSMRDLAFALEQVSLAPSAGVSAVLPRRRLPGWFPWAVAAVAAIVSVALAIFVASRPELDPGVRAPLRFQMQIPGSISITGSGNFVAVAPDGRSIAFSATRNGIPVLWLQPLGSLSPEPIPDSERPTVPFWSPDSRFIGFFADGKLKKVLATGGPPQTLCDAALAPTGGTWNAAGVILFSGLYGPIRRVDDSGGAAAPVTAPQSEEEMHLYPQFLPDGKRFLFLLHSTDPQRSGIYVKSIDSPEIRLVVRAESRFAYVRPGYLVYAREGLLLAHPFDIDSATVTGQPIPTPDRVEQMPETGNVAFSLSADGVLAYRAAAQAGVSHLRWFDRSGTPLETVGEPDTYRNPRLSPDGRKVAVEVVDKSGNRDIWVLDAAAGTSTKFTFDPGRDASPVWTHDGKRIAWQARAHTRIKDLSGGSEEELHSEPWIPDDWLPDGSGLLLHPGQPRQIFLLSLTPTRHLRSIIQRRSTTSHARPSPDGKWIAFANSDSGRFEIDVQDFPAGVMTTRVSTDGGIQPKWGPDGKELFYLRLDGTLMSVPIKFGESIEVGARKPLFATGAETTTGLFWHQYDTRDGRRFLINVPTAPAPLMVVVNWPALLQDR